MTQITPSELKMIYIQIFMMALVGVLLLLYSLTPISQQYSINTVAANTSSVSASDAGWLNEIMPEDAGLGSILPGGMADLIFVSSIFLVPLTIMNALTAIRIIKDLSTQWI